MAPLGGFSTQSARDGVRRGNASSAHFLFAERACQPTRTQIDAAARSDAALPPSRKVELVVECLGVRTPQRLCRQLVLDVAAPPTLAATSAGVGGNDTSARRSVVVPLPPFTKRAKVSVVVGAQHQASITLKVTPALTDLAFVLTFFKCQGQTMDRVIIDLSSASRPDLAGFFVALSRVRQSVHMRRLPDPDDGGVAFEQSPHLLRLTHNPQLVAWRRALTETSGGSGVYRYHDAARAPRPQSQAPAQRSGRGRAGSATAAAAPRGGRGRSAPPAATTSLPRNAARK